MTIEADRLYMRHALGLGARGLGRSWPNPSVGCVVVRDGRVVGRGWTQPGGRPHAEVVALLQAGSAARGSTVYVTLEPCAHHGKTPPCAGALAAAGVARVVMAMLDPDPRVSGRGRALLGAAGIDTSVGIEEDAARLAHAGFLRRIALGLPMVTLKLAVSLDGRIATASGESRWITGPDARRMVHAMRLSHDAVMVGAGTVRVDDPDLRARDMGAPWQPVRVVVDTLARVSPDSRLGQTAHEVPVWILHGSKAPKSALEAWSERGARVIECGQAGDRVDARSMLLALGAEGLTRVLCEGGGELASSLLKADLVTEIAVFGAGLAIGADGVPSIGPCGLSHLADAGRFGLMSVQSIGNDILSRWRRT